MKYEPTPVPITPPELLARIEDPTSGISAAAEYITQEASNNLVTEALTAQRAELAEKVRQMDRCHKHTRDGVLIDAGCLGYIEVLKVLEGKK